MKSLNFDKVIIARFKDGNTGEVIKKLKSRGFKTLYMREKGHFFKNKKAVIVELNHNYLNEALNIIKQYKSYVVTETMPIMEGIDYAEHCSILNTAQIPVIHGGVSYFVLDLMQSESC